MRRQRVSRKVACNTPELPPPESAHVVPGPPVNPEIIFSVEVVPETEEEASTLIMILYQFLQKKPNHILSVSLSGRGSSLPGSMQEILS